MEFFRISKSQEEITSRSAKTNDDINSNLTPPEILCKKKKKPTQNRTNQATSDVLSLMDRLNITSLLHCLDFS